MQFSNQDRRPVTTAARIDRNILLHSSSRPHIRLFSELYKHCTIFITAVFLGQHFLYWGWSVHVFLKTKRYQIYQSAQKETNEIKQKPPSFPSELDQLPSRAPQGQTLSGFVHHENVSGFLRRHINRTKSTSIPEINPVQFSYSLRPYTIPPFPFQS